MCWSRGWGSGRGCERYVASRPTAGTPVSGGWNLYAKPARACAGAVHDKNMTTTTDDLTLLTLDDIRQRIQTKAASSRDKAPWEKLTAVVDELNLAATTGADLIITGRRWNLASVRVFGFRGIEGDLRLDIDPSPGVTVIHGPNGAGKSSIADAVEIALGGRGVSGQAARRTGTNRLIWDPIEQAQGSERTEIEVVLVAERDQLHFNAVWEGGGATLDAILTEGDRSRSVPLDGAWRELMAAHSPISAYAALERQIQTGGHLTEFLTSRLALGATFGRLLASVGDHQEESIQAYKRINDTWKSAAKDASLADRSWQSDAGEEVVPLRQPELGEDPTVWVRDNGLAGHGAAVPELTASAVANIKAAATSVLEALEALAARAEQDVAWGEQLERLYDAAQDDAHDGDCPVCGTATQWFEVLATGVEARRAVHAARASANTAVQCLLRAVRVVHPALTGALDGPELDPLGLSRAIEMFDHAMASDAPGERRGSALALAQLLASDVGDETLAAAVKRSDRRAQWHRERAEAMAPFLQVWRAEAGTAMAAPGWKAVTQRCKDLEKALIKERSGILRAKADSLIGDLLRDAGLHLSVVDLGAKDALIELKDPSDQTLRLGMLSAGQRNAVLLAPLIGTIDSNPFGFLILDDPVHAFDDMRVDALAASLAKIGADRRVVVLTHDERLRQHLRARSERVEVFDIHRDATTRAVTTKRRSSVALDLLEDAGDLLSALGTSPITLDTTYTVRGLCRFAVEAALRDHRVRRAIREGEDSNAILAAIDARRTLRECIDFVSQGDSDDVVQQAIASTKDYIGRWDQAAHRSGELGTDLRAEIRSARRACTALSTSAVRP